MWRTYIYVNNCNTFAPRNFYIALKPFHASDMARNIAPSFGGNHSQGDDSPCQSSDAGGLFLTAINDQAPLRAESKRESRARSLHDKLISSVGKWNFFSLWGNMFVKINLSHYDTKSYENNGKCVIFRLYL